MPRQYFTSLILSLWVIAASSVALVVLGIIALIEVTQ